MVNWYRVHLVYIADGMVHPLSTRKTVVASSHEEAVMLATEGTERAYVSGFKVLLSSSDKKGPVSATP